MNEKHKQYYGVGNGKELIDRKNPTENDVQRFSEWSENKRKELKNSFPIKIISLLIFVIVGLALKNVLGILLMILCVYLIYSSVKELANSKKWTFEYCDYGVVTDKYIKEEKKDNDYYVIIEANGNLLRYKLKKQEFEEINISDEVIIFAIQNEQRTFWVKK